MRGTRVKALVLSYYQTFGSRPSKTRYATQRVKPSGWWQRFVWWLKRYRPEEAVRYSGAWRRWKKMANEANREIVLPRDRGVPKNRPNLARRKRRAAELHAAKRQFETSGAI